MRSQQHGFKLKQQPSAHTDLLIFERKNQNIALSSCKASSEAAYQVGGGSKSMSLLLEDDLWDQSPSYADNCISVISEDELG